MSSSVDNLKALVNAKTLTQYNNQVCTQYAFNSNVFTPITVLTSQNDDPSGGSNGDYSIHTGTGALYLKSGGSWGTVNNSAVYISYLSNATYNNKVYTTNSSGVLSTVNSDNVRTSSSKAYATNGSGLATALSAGRYFNSTTNPEQVYDIASSVTDGTYTTVSFSNGQILATNSACWCLVNNNWVQLN
jgi:hypothetical protein